MKFVIFSVIFLSACSSVSTPGRVLVHSEKSADEVFKIIAHAISSSPKFTVELIEPEMGFIRVVRNDLGELSSNTMIFISVKETERGFISVDINSTYRDVVSYGITKKNIKILFDLLYEHFPDAEFTMDGKPYILEN